MLNEVVRNDSLHGGRDLIVKKVLRSRRSLANDYSRSMVERGSPVWPLVGETRWDFTLFL